MASSPGDSPARGIRPTAIGPFNAAQGTSNRARQVPVPWVDCSACKWRHYPSTAGGRWHIATACANCGAKLVIPAAAVPTTAPRTGAGGS
jgi:hypothetical protein